MCVPISQQLLPETYLILGIQRDIIYMYTALHVKYPSSLSDFNKTWIFWADFGKVFK